MSKYAIIDLEMCFVPHTPETAAFLRRNELIQIGAVLLDEEYEPIDTFMTLVAPQYGAIDDYIEKLTGISPAAAAKAPCTADALNAFTEWLPEDAVIVSWSDTDRSQIIHELECKHISIPSMDGYLESWQDCQQMFSEKMDTAKIYKLSEALIIADIDSVDGEHDALVDARNTAKLFAKIQREPVLKLNSYYETSEDFTPATHNPFAALLANFKVTE